MFDPFKDFGSAGYLRNRYGIRDMRIIKNLEHTVFLRNLPQALAALNTAKTIQYTHFLAVHKLLFSELYPWAGLDRTITSPTVNISKADIHFCHPIDIRRAVEEGLRLSRDPTIMTSRPGKIMGFFAYGHPFLDGNGRTMLLIHIELAYRAGLAIAWGATSKLDYLTALSAEITNPNAGALDAYLKPFITLPAARITWPATIAEMVGLDGLATDRIAQTNTEPAVIKAYAAFNKNRQYRTQASPATVCPLCQAEPCHCCTSSLNF